MKTEQPTYKELLDKVTELEASLAKTQWLHKSENSTMAEPYIPFYGDVTELNTERTILDTVGKDTLKTMTSELMDLLDTSVAIYEKNGDYAYGVFNSGWCQLLDASSRKLCNTNDNKTALNCGKWHCHDDCWNNSAKAAILARKSTDIDCIGAIKLYAEPIFVGDEVIGVINIGYGNPPTDDETLQELAEKFRVDFDTLKQKALDYKQRPDFIIEMAKKRLKSIAKLIGEIVSRKKAEETLKVNNERYKKAQEIGNVGNWEYNIQTTEFWGSQQGKRIYGLDPERDEFSAEQVYKHVVNRDKVEQAMIDLLNKNKKYDIEFEITPKNGTKNRYIRSIARLERDKNGNPYKVVGVLHDITERRKAEQDLIKAKQKAEESEDKFSTIFNMSQSFICIADINTTTFKFINPTFNRILGYTNEELLNKPFTDFIHPDDVASTIEVVEKQLKAGNPVLSFENRYSRKDGGYCWLNWNSYPVPEKGITYAIAHDVTSRKKAEQELQLKNEEYETMNEELRQTNEELFVAKEQTEESERELSLTLDATTDGIWKWNFIENELFFSPNYYRMLGYEPYEFEANYENWVALIHPNDRAKAIKTAETWLAKKDTDYENTFRLQTKNNDYLWLISTGKVVERNKNGTAVRMIGNHINITPVKKAQKEITKHIKEFQTWIQNTPVCTKKIDLDFNLQFMSQAGIKELKVDDVNKLYGAPYPFDFFPQDFRKAILEKMKQVRETCEITQIDGILSDTQGRTMWYNHILVPVKNTEGKLDYILIISTDISERKRVEQELKEKNAEYEALNEELRQTNEELYEAKEQAEESSKLKTAFLNNISHEFRTPMNGILGFAELLLKPNKTERQRIKYAEMIQESCDKLLDIVNDVIEISQIQSDMAEIKMEKCNLKEIIDQSVEIFEPKMNKKELSFCQVIECKEDELIIKTDKQKIYRVLKHILDNALKFTSQGGVKLKCTLNNDTIEISVSDTGIGIEPELKHIIFEPFRQAELGLTRSFGGNGIGLSLVKSYMELIGGNIEIQSEVGKGTTVTLYIPAKPESEKALITNENIEKEIDWSDITVLIVEDEPINFMYLEELLIDAGAKTIYAKNGQEAVDFCKRKKKIDIILMDLKMPVMDGYTAAKIIKKTNPGLPIIAQSAYALEHEIEQYRDIFDDYLTKPIKQEKLIQRIKKQIENYEL